MLRVSYEELLKEFERVLISRGFNEKNALDAATVFAQNSLDGIYSHGINRFPRVVEYLDKGEINPDVVATCEMSMGAIERWEGHRGFGPLNAKQAMDRAIELAGQYGIGMVALGNSNHWMRGGSYGWQAANAGCIGICWSNTMPNMPAWGGKDRKIGNNPLILAVPKSNGDHVVVDCAVSQFSYGKIEEARLKGQQLPVPGGYDEDGNLISTVLTNANSVQKIGTFGDEIGLSQIMIAIDPGKFNDAETTDRIVDELVSDIKSSIPAQEGGKVFYPGEIEINNRRDNMENGIPVIEEKWNAILAM